MPVQCCPEYCIYEVSFEVKNFEPLAVLLLKHCLGYSGSFAFLHNKEFGWSSSLVSGR